MAKSFTLFKRKNLEDNRQTFVKDRPIKSIIKAITWRVVGTLDTMLIAFLITGKFVMAISIGGIEVFTKIGLYYLHERAWEQIRWGRMMVVIRRNSRSARKSITKMVLKEKIKVTNESI